MSTTEDVAPDAATMTRRQRWMAAGVLSMSLLVIVMDLTILNIAIPDLAEDLRPSANQLLWIVDRYSLVLAGVLVSVSAVGDRWGRKSGWERLGSPPFMRRLLGRASWR